MGAQPDSRCTSVQRRSSQMPATTQPTHIMQKDVLPRKHRLEALLKELDAS
jgi:hypothetical protein